MKKMLKWLLLPALLLTGCGRAANPQSDPPEQPDDVPPILFRQVTVYPQEEDGSKQNDTVTFTDREGKIWHITDAETARLSDKELALQFAAEKLTDKLEQTGFRDAGELYTQYDIAAGEILHQGIPMIVCPDAVPAVEEPHSYYYVMYDEYNALYGDVREEIQRVCIGEAFCGIQFPADNEKITAVCEWLRTSAQKKE